MSERVHHPTRFCATCGVLMGWRRKIVGYNERTGRPVFEYIFRCQRQRVWTVGHASITVQPEQYYEAGTQD